jgi:peptidoglycan hydrolase-like protein with peptidoglycan-binding domain
VTRAGYLSAPELVAAGRSPVAHQPFLAPGERGEAVAAWQQDLNRWSAAAGAAFGRLTVDGGYGPATEQATRELQHAQSITVDGLAGPETRAALASAPALVNVSPLPPPSTPIVLA